MKRSALLVLIFFFAATSLRAVDIDSNAGTRGFKFLQVYSHARDAALAGATTSNISTQPSLSTNPAGLASVERFNAMGTHVEWLGTIRQEYASVAIPAYGGGVGIALRTQTSGEIPLRSVSSESGHVGVPSPTPSGTYGVYDGAVTVSFGRQYGDVAWGSSAKYIWEKIYLNSVTALAFDFGAIWQRGDLSVGGVVRNVGMSNKLKNERIDLPWDLQIGTSYGHSIGSTGIHGMADFRYSPDWHESAHVGLEIDFDTLLVLRVGYRTALGAQTDTDGFTTGVGLAYGPIGIDYSYIPTNTSFGSEHLFTVKVTP